MQKPLFDEFDNLEFIGVEFKNQYKGILGLIKLFKF